MLVSKPDLPSPLPAHLSVRFFFAVSRETFTERGRDGFSKAVLEGGGGESDQIRKEEEGGFEKRLTEEMAKA